MNPKPSRTLWMQSWQEGWHTYDIPGDGELVGTKRWAS